MISPRLPSPINIQTWPCAIDNRDTQPDLLIDIETWLCVSNDAVRVTVTKNGELYTDVPLFPGYEEEDRNENRNAYQNLFNSIKTYYPDQSYKVTSRIESDFKDGKALTSEMIREVLYMMDEFNAEWVGQSSDPASLSPRTDEGKELIFKFNMLVNDRFFAVDAYTAEDRLVVLEAIKQEILNSQLTSHAIKSKLNSLIELTIQRATFAQNVIRLKIPYLSSMTEPEGDCWHLLMDWDQQDNGIYHFENEQGYMAAMLTALNLMMDSLDAKLDAPLLCTLHDTAVNQVRERDELGLSAEIVQEIRFLPKKYRNEEQISFSTIMDVTCTQEGEDEFLMSSKTEWSYIDKNSELIVCEYSRELISDACHKGQYTIDRSRDPDPPDAESHAGLIIQSINTYYSELELALKIDDPAERKKAVSDCRNKCDEAIHNSPLEIHIKSEDIQKACEDKAAEIIATYHDDFAYASKTIGEHEKETAVLSCIAKCCQDLFQHHVFSDGNTRTIMFLIMNKLLLQNKLSPAILMEPNAICMYSVEQIVDLIREGQTNFSQFLEMN